MAFPKRPGDHRSGEKSSAFATLGGTRHYALAEMAAARVQVFYEKRMLQLVPTHVSYTCTLRLRCSRPLSAEHALPVAAAAYGHCTQSPFHWCMRLLSSRVRSPSSSASRLCVTLLSSLHAVIPPRVHAALVQSWLLSVKAVCSAAEPAVALASPYHYWYRC